MRKIYFLKENLTVQQIKILILSCQFKLEYAQGSHVDTDTIIDLEELLYCLHSVRHDNIEYVAQILDKIAEDQHPKMQIEERKANFKTSIEKLFKAEVDKLSTHDPDMSLSPIIKCYFEVFLKSPYFFGTGKILDEDTSQKPRQKDLGEMKKLGIISNFSGDGKSISVFLSIVAEMKAKGFDEKYLPKIVSTYTADGSQLSWMAPAFSKEYATYAPIFIFGQLSFTRKIISAPQNHISRIKKIIGISRRTRP
ncbi:MAG: hypothetical protein LBI56_02260 [Puniceicoccales bacterium]|jgi:hypothetical protein|nr:hypothetical protein [Puniceicoccales bacterium]